MKPTPKQIALDAALEQSHHNAKKLAGEIETLLVLSGEPEAMQRSAEHALERSRAIIVNLTTVIKNL